MKVSEYHFQLHLNKQFAVIADLHDSTDPHIVELLTERKPDAIFIVGDLVDRRSADFLDTTVMFLRKCALLAPTFYSFGNHEKMLLDSDLKLIKSHGVSILDNGWEKFEECYIGGLSTDAREALNDNERLRFRENTILRREMSYLKKRRHFKNDVYTQSVHHSDIPQICWINEFEQCKGTKILLCHHPEYYGKYLKEKNIDLIVSGHAHGGQMRLFGHGLYSTGQGFLPKYTSGVYDGHLVVSRGLSNTMPVIPRLFNPEELVFLCL